MNIQLRETKSEDLDFVIEAERDRDNRNFVGQWERTQHENSMQDPDIGHYILERTTDNKAVGYIILVGKSSADRSIEFRRLVVTEKRRGFGREALRLAQKLSFDSFSTNRFWLDVRDHNERAQKLYDSERFVREGLLRECVWVEDHFESLIIYSVLKSEFKR